MLSTERAYDGDSYRLWVGGVDDPTRSALCIEWDRKLTRWGRRITPGWTELGLGHLVLTWFRKVKR